MVINNNENKKFLLFFIYNVDLGLFESYLERKEEDESSG